MSETKLIKVVVEDDAIINGVDYQRESDLNSADKFIRERHHHTINFKELHLPSMKDIKPKIIAAQFYALDEGEECLVMDVSDVKELINEILNQLKG